MQWKLGPGVAVVVVVVVVVVVLAVAVAVVGDVVPAVDQLGSGWVGRANNCDRNQTPFPYIQ